MKTANPTFLQASCITTPGTVGKASYFHFAMHFITKVTDHWHNLVKCCFSACKADFTIGHRIIGATVLNGTNVKSVKLARILRDNDEGSKLYS